MPRFSNTTSTNPAVAKRQELVRHYLSLLPKADEWEFHDLTEWEQEFLESVRKQFAARGDLSERQYEILERIYTERS